MQKLMHETFGYDNWYSIKGLRADEMHRVEKQKKRAGRDREFPLAPLADAGVTKEAVVAWWKTQPFDLELPNVGGVTPLGNCVLCPLKARAKLVNVLRRLPEEAVWWAAQEDAMTERIRSIPREKPGPDRRNRFHKKGTSYRDLLAEAEQLNSINAPMDEGYDAGIDCLCTD